MKLHEITRRGLAKSDDEWVAAEGFIICWGTTAFPRKWAKPVTYFWGQGPPGGPWGGWESARHAYVYSSYQNASGGVVQLLKNEPPVFLETSFLDRFARGIPDSDIRIVKVRIQQPVVVLDDMPYDVLQRMAEV